MVEPAAVSMAERRSPAAAFAARFEAASAGGGLRLAEIPFLSQINLRVDPKSPAAERIGTAMGVPLPMEPGTAAGGGDLEVLWLGPDEWLVVGPDGAAPGLVERLAEAAAGEHVSVVDVSAQRTALVVAGERARDVLAHGCVLDLHPRVFGPGRVAQTTLARAGVVLVAGEDGFRLLVRSSFAAYVAEWLLDASVEYVTSPAGEADPA
ncbi:sarcosine oxidase subunit gamma [Microbispora rosea]|uniref:Sarcosine oxidase subunit gamma n=2 Tax=Microbispora rosea TaxID=58117 RepID=A0A1N7H1L7_9ACTN|nr:sarcosine oxidase subunit gamma family protein [Microbispora rosea]GIH48334.1 sarcosine oxidase subunit gamma [Microbispora rosea subsp. rosea]SIS18715.1 sarcosine oxidase subunit gamma [Microbispora rosea]